MIKIVVPNRRYNRGILSLGEDLTNEELQDICYLTTGSKEFELVKDNNRSTGRYIEVLENEKIYYVGISNREVGGRNSFVQTIATVFSAYTNSKSKNKKLCYYFLKFRGNNLTDYLKFCYRLMHTIGFDFINPNVGFGKLILKSYDKVTDIIKDRNFISSTRSSNNSTYTTEKGYKCRIYGKAFGANSKETALICFAISFIADKPVKLIQIMDNNSDSLSENDKKAITKLNKIEIIDDTYIFDEEEISDDPENIRSARFIYNLLAKYGEKKCVLCDCQIPIMISGAHIWPVSDIKKTALSLEDKKSHAADSNNGIWLCENHHKLFDSDLLCFDETGKIILSHNLNEDNKSFVNSITTQDSITMNNEMLGYFKLRYQNK